MAMVEVQLKLGISDSEWTSTIETCFTHKYPLVGTCDDIKLAFTLKDRFFNSQK
jgi:hypothetical protein